MSRTKKAPRLALRLSFIIKRYQSFSNTKWFYDKKFKIGGKKSVSNRKSSKQKQMWCAIDNHNYLCQGFLYIYQFSTNLCQVSHALKNRIFKSIIVKSVKRLLLPYKSYFSDTHVLF